MSSRAIPHAFTLKGRGYEIYAVSEDPDKDITWVLVRCVAVEELWNAWAGTGGSSCPRWPISQDRHMKIGHPPPRAGSFCTDYYYATGDMGLLEHWVWVPWDFVSMTLARLACPNDSRFPHTCTFCGAPAYIGAVPAALDCSKKCRP